MPKLSKEITSKIIEDKYGINTEDKVSFHISEHLKEYGINTDEIYKQLENDRMRRERMKTIISFDRQSIPDLMLQVLQNINAKSIK